MAKNIGIIIVLILIAMVFWTGAKSWLESSGRFSTPSLWILPGAALVVLIVAAGLAFMFLKGGWTKLLVPVVIGGLFVAVFGFERIYVFGLAVFFVLHMYATWRTREELEERTKVNVRMVMRRVLPMVTTSFMIMISFAYYATPVVQNSARTGELPPEVAESVEKGFAKGFELFASGELRNLSLTQREEAKEEILGRTLYSLTKALEPYFRYFPPLLAFGLFIILQGLGVVFMWISVFLAMGVFWILRKTGFVRIETHDVKAEVLIV